MYTDFIIFAGVMKRRTILSLFSVLGGLLFLIGSTGITVIIHSCRHCGDYSVHAGLFLSPEIPEDHCCESAINRCAWDNSGEYIGDCCHFRVDRLSLTNYTPSEKIFSIIPVEIQYTYFIPLLPVIPEVTINSFLNHNKHGGRYIVTGNCQFLS